MEENTEKIEWEEKVWNFFAKIVKSIFQGIKNHCWRIYSLTFHLLVIAMCISLMILGRESYITYKTSFLKVFSLIIGVIAIMIIAISTIAFCYTLKLKSDKACKRYLKKFIPYI